MMEIFNIRHANTPSDAVNIMRPGPWGNPFSEKEWGREACIKLFEHWLFLNPALVSRMRAELARKDLVCCCFPKACHGDVIRRVVEGEEPQPLDADDPLLNLYLSRQRDPLAEGVGQLTKAMDKAFLEGSRPKETLPNVQGAWNFLKPTLERMIRGRQEQWPQPPQELITVSKADLVTWREDWLQAYAKGDGTDEVTPFDQHLYGRKP